MSSKVIFLHIIKCGGMSMRRMLANYHNHDDIMPVAVGLGGIDLHKAYPNKVVRSTIEYGRSTEMIESSVSYSVIMGHYDFETAQLLPDWDVIVLLREPLELAKSLYRYMKGNYYNQYHNVYRWLPNATFDDWVRHRDIQPFLNIQTTYMSSHRYPHLGNALKNLRLDRVHIGLLEALPESIARFNSAFGWELQLEHINRTEGNTELSSSTLEHLKRVQSNDIQLYKEAKRLFYEQSANSLETTIK